MKLYAIDPDLVEPRWTELGLARLLSDGALVEDTRLRAIADAYWAWQNAPVMGMQGKYREFHALMVALQEDTDET
jgi:hypothetical protein